MNYWIFLALWLASSGSSAQTGDGFNSDAERARISADRARLEASFAQEESACYKKFWVNSCLEEVKVRSRDALADLKRQEIVLNNEMRRAKAAEQLQKIEDKSPPEKLQQEADRRAQAAKDLEDKIARDQQKATARETSQAGEKAKSDAGTSRAKDNQTKAAQRAAKQALEADERRKYSERVEQAKERQARFVAEKASKAKTPAKPLPVPD